MRASDVILIHTFGRLYLIFKGHEMDANLARILHSFIPQGIDGIGGGGFDGLETDR